MKSYLLFFAFVLLFTSCKIQGLTDDYKKLTKPQQEIIQPLNSFENISARKIYTINAPQLLEEIKLHPKALVYVFTNGCPSESCKPMFVYENYANKNGYKLFLVMSGFASLDDTMNQPFESPLFAIDATYYKTIYRGKYTRFFFNELEGKPIDEKMTSYESLFFYEDGQLMERRHLLPI